MSDPLDDLSPEESAELAPHFGPDSPLPAAQLWLQLVLVDGDIAAAWPLTDENLRLALVQNLIWDNLDRSAGEWVLDQHAWALSRPAPTHEDWPAMQAGLLRVLRAKWEGAPPPDRWGAIRPRVVDGDHELVLFVPEIPEGQRIPVDGVVRSYPVLMAHRDDGWLVAGFLDRPPVPGWPPTFPTTDAPLDLR